MPRCEAILETTNQVCNSNAKLNKVRVEDPNQKYSKTIFVCQKCSDRIYGPMDALLQHWMNKKDVDWEIKKSEITKIRWKNCRHCLHPDQEIITKNGLKKISEIKTGDMVLSHRGIFRSVTNVIEHDYDGEMLTIETKGANKAFKIRTTSNHDFIIKESGYNGKGLVWKNFFVTKGYDLREYKQGQKNQYIPFPRMIEINDIESENYDKMRVYGYYLAEGSITFSKKRGYSNEVRFTFGKSQKEYSIAEELVLSLKNLGYNSTLRFDGTGWRVRLYKKDFTKFILDTFDTGSNKKKIPYWIKSLPIEKLAVLFQSYLNGDGHKEKLRKQNGNELWTCSTVSKQLALDLRDIALKLGYTTSITLDDSPKNIMRRVVNTKKIYRLRFSIGNQIIKNDKDYVYLAIKKIEREYYFGKVYDLEVNQDHTFCTPYHAVHNCNHDLGCHCIDPVCQNKFNEIWHVIFFSYTGKLRQDFQLHRKCAFIVMKKLGMIKELKILSDQVSMEKFLDVTLTEPPKLQTIQQTQQIIPHKKHCKACDIWMDDEQYKQHMEQYYREGSTDNIIVKQYTGKHEKMIETHVCELHSRRAIFTTNGQWSCPVFGCTEQIKVKMLSMQNSEDYMICLFHQSKLRYDPNSGKMQCQVRNCDSKIFMKRSYLLSMVKEGFIEFNGEKVPIDIDSRTVVLDGYTIILKI